MNSTTIISGVIYKINPTEQYADFTKRTFWIQELNVQYPNMWQLEMWHDDVLLLESFKPLDIVVCNTTVKGKKLENRITGNEYVINILRCDSIKRI